MVHLRKPCSNTFSNGQVNGHFHAHLRLGNTGHLFLVGEPGADEDDVFEAEAAAAATFSSILGLLRLTSREFDGLDDEADALVGLDSACCCLVGEPPLLAVVVSALDAVRVFRRAGAAAGLRGDLDVAGDLSLPFDSVSFYIINFVD